MSEVIFIKGNFKIDKYFGSFKNSPKLEYLLFKKRKQHSSGLYGIE
jgi:hypothetical protein